MAGGERVRVAHENDRNRRGRSLSRRGVDGTRCHDDIDLEPDKFLRKFAHPLRLAFRPSVLDGDVPALHIAQLAKSLAESFKGIRKYVWTVPQKTDAVDLPACCARTATGQAITVPPRSVMNSRRFIRSPRQRERAVAQARRGPALAPSAD